MRGVAFRLALGAVSTIVLLGAVELVWIATLLCVLIAEHVRSNLLLSRLLDLLDRPVR